MEEQPDYGPQTAHVQQFIEECRQLREDDREALESAWNARDEQAVDEARKLAEKELRDAGRWDDLDRAHTAALATHGYLSETWDVLEPVLEGERYEPPEDEDYKVHLAPTNAVRDLIEHAVLALAARDLIGGATFRRLFTPWATGRRQGES